ncbi:MAG TPA: branched-chain amino acid ABC transporter permease [Alphaproteobacteria bacterium]
MILGLKSAKIPLVLAALVAVAGCSKVDASQAEVCNRVAGVVLSEGAIEQIENDVDRAVPHGIVSRVIVRKSTGARAPHEVHCEFAGGAFSDERLHLIAVTTDAEGRLTDLRMAILEIVLAKSHAQGESAGAGQREGPLRSRVGSDVLYFVQQLVNGATLGCIVALIAIGYTLVYSIIGAINFAFGELYMLGAFIAVVGVALFIVLGIDSPTFSVVLALPIAMAFNAGYGWLMDRTVFRPLRKANPLMPLIAAIGLSIVLQNYVFVTEGAGNIWLPEAQLSGFALAESDGFSLYVNPKQAMILAIMVVLSLGTWYLLAKTPYGRAQRASSQDRKMAALVGIDIDRTVAATFALGGALAAAGGLMVASYYGGVNFSMGFLMGFKALTAAIVGGMGNFAGALLGGFVVAFVETFWAGYLQSAYREIAVFSLLILLLVFRPQGILGER